MKKTKPAARPNFPNTRKALRKKKRQEKKIHRQEHYLKKKNTPEQPKFTPGRFVKRPPEASDPGPEPKKKKQKPQPSVQDVLNKERQREKKEVQHLSSQMDKQRKKMLLQANEEEEKIIKKLEKQMGLNKSKNKNNYFHDDGLDYLLEICDKSTTQQIVAAEKHLAEVEAGSDFEDDLAAVTGKEPSRTSEKASKKKGQSDENYSDEDDSGSDEEMSPDNRKSNKKKDKVRIDDDSDDSSEFDDENDFNTRKDSKKSNKIRKDSQSDEAGEFSDHDEDISESEDNIGSDFDEESDTSDDAPEEKPTQTKKSLALKTKLKEIDNKQENLSKKAEPKRSKERIISEDDLSKVFSDDEVSHLSGDEEVSDDEIGDIGEEISKSKEKPDVWEDIYGRKRDKEGNIIKEEKGVYIPPHLRNKDSTSDKELAQLKRQIKSVLNKLSGTNLHWACTTLEALYGANSRYSVNTALTQLWLDATVAPTVTPDRMVAEHAALISVLHANVGTEIGAHFLQELTKMFDEMTQAPQSVGDKRLDNLVSCLAHLYSFKIYHATLLYDILSRLLEEISEKSIDCVLVALRSVGGVLRKDEPLALKEFIHDTQGRVAKLNESAADGTRIKFLLEVLMAVKNNNLTKIPNYEPTYTEHLKKFTRGVVRKGNYITPLNIRLEDLLKVDERGKWWVVGSAWEGNRTIEDKPAKTVPAADQKLLDLARKQRMNTDVRRSIFCVIMSAEDYMDAFEKLHHLGLKGQQEREIVHVLLACCLQEKSYNPYYAVLGQKLCDTDRRYQLSIQYSLWDKIKELESLSRQCTTNLAQFLVHLIMGKGLPISVLKIIQFSDLNKQSVGFMRQVLLAIIMNEDLQAALEVFHRVSKAPKLHIFRESLRLFIQHFLMKKAGKTSLLSDEETVVLKDRTAEVDRILIMHESKMRL